MLLPKSILVHILKKLDRDDALSLLSVDKKHRNLFYSLYFDQFRTDFKEEYATDKRYYSFIENCTNLFIFYKYLYGFSSINLVKLNLFVEKTDGINIDLSNFLQLIELDIYFIDIKEVISLILPRQLTECKLSQSETKNNLVVNLSNIDNIDVLIIGYGIVCRNSFLNPRKLSIPRLSDINIVYLTDLFLGTVKGNIDLGKYYQLIGLTINEIGKECEIVILPRNLQRFKVYNSYSKTLKMELPDTLLYLNVIESFKSDIVIPKKLQELYLNSFGLLFLNNNTSLISVKLKCFGGIYGKLPNTVKYLHCPTYKFNYEDLNLVTCIFDDHWCKSSRSEKLADRIKLYKYNDTMDFSRFKIRELILDMNERIEKIILPNALQILRIENWKGDIDNITENVLEIYRNCTMSKSSNEYLNKLGHSPKILNLYGDFNKDTISENIYNKITSIRTTQIISVNFENLTWLKLYLSKVINETLILPSRLKYFEITDDFSRGKCNLDGDIYAKNTCLEEMIINCNKFNRDIFFPTGNTLKKLHIKSREYNREINFLPIGLQELKMECPKQKSRFSCLPNTITKIELIVSTLRIDLFPKNLSRLDLNCRLAKRLDISYLNRLFSLRFNIRNKKRIKLPDNLYRIDMSGEIDLNIFDYLDGKRIIGID